MNRSAHRSRMIWLFCWAVVAAGFSIVCSPAFDGEEGNLRFSFAQDTTDDTLTVLVGRKVAVGAKLDLVVSSLGNDSQDVVSIDRASLVDEDIFSVAIEQPDRISLAARQAGSTRLEVAATLSALDSDDGEDVDDAAPVVNDSIVLEAAEATSLKLSHRCPALLASTYPDEDIDREQVAYLVNNDIRIPFELRDDQDSLLLGYGYAPINFDDAWELTLDTTSRDLGNYYLNTGATPGNATIGSELLSDPFELFLIEESDIDGAALLFQEQLQSSDITLQKNQRLVLPVAPTHRQRTVCFAQTDMQVASTTPSTCVATIASSSQANALESLIALNVVEIIATAPGECHVEVSYPAANQGEGVSTQLTILVE